MHVKECALSEMRATVLTDCFPGETALLCNICCWTWFSAWSPQVVRNKHLGVQTRYLCILFEGGGAGQECGGRTMLNVQEEEWRVQVLE